MVEKWKQTDICSIFEKTLRLNLVEIFSLSFTIHVGPGAGFVCWNL